MNSHYSYELNKTYLSFEGEELPDENDYRLKMIYRNAPEGLIMLSERSINGKRYIYADITELESLQHIVSVNHADKETVMNLFKDLKLACDELEGFLIDNGELMLSPEFIFRNIRTGGFCFLCLPTDRHEDFSGSFNTLISFLINNLDSADTELLEGLISLLDASERGTPVLNNIYESFCREPEEIIPGPECTEETEETEKIKRKIIPEKVFSTLKNIKEISLTASFAIGMAMVLWAVCFW